MHLEHALVGRSHKDPTLPTSIGEIRQNIVAWKARVAIQVQMGFFLSKWWWWTWWWTSSFLLLVCGWCVAGVLLTKMIILFAVSCSDKIIRLFFWILLLAYVPVSSTIMRYYLCEPIGDKYYLVADLRVECYTSSYNDVAFTSACGILL